MGVLQCFSTYAAESDHTTAVCVVGHRVARIFSMIYDTHHRCMCTYILHGKEVVTVDIVFPVATQFTKI